MQTRLEEGVASTHRRRRGISDLMATVLLIAMTLIAGAAVFGYVNGQAASNESKLGAANAANVNFLNERFVVVDLAISAGGNSAFVWIYNNGNLDLNLQQLVLYQASNQQNFYVIFNNNPASGGCGSASAPSFGSTLGFVFGSGGTTIPKGGNPLEITLQLPAGCLSGFASQTTYDINVLGIYGNDVVYAACDSNAVCTN